MQKSFLECNIVNFLSEKRFFRFPCHNIKHFSIAFLHRNSGKIWKFSGRHRKTLTNKHEKKNAIKFWLKSFFRFRFSLKPPTSPPPPRKLTWNMKHIHRWRTKWHGKLFSRFSPVFFWFCMFLSLLLFYTSGMFRLHRNEKIFRIFIFQNVVWKILLQIAWWMIDARQVANISCVFLFFCSSCSSPAKM